jgi:hypothetical protein
MTNDEVRMANETAMTNDEGVLARARANPVMVPFVIAVSLFIRHSGFVIRHSFGE